MEVSEAASADAVMLSFANAYYEEKHFFKKKAAVINEEYNATINQMCKLSNAVITSISKHWWRTTVETQKTNPKGSTPDELSTNSIATMEIVAKIWQSTIYKVMVAAGTTMNPAAINI